MVPHSRTLAPVSVEATIEQDFKITPEQLEQTITPKTRALIICSPHILPRPLLVCLWQSRGPGTVL